MHAFRDGVDEVVERSGRRILAPHRALSRHEPVERYPELSVAAGLSGSHVGAMVREESVPTLESAARVAEDVALTPAARLDRLAEALSKPLHDHDRTARDTRHQSGSLTKLLAVAKSLAMSFGERVRVVRERRGLSALALDRRAGLTPGHSAQIESGRVPRVSLKTAAAIAEALDVRIDWLATGKGPERRASS